MHKIHTNDDRRVIIDSKVSLNAILRYMNSNDQEEQKLELAGHVRAVRAHIDELNSLGYDEYDKMRIHAWCNFVSGIH